MMIFFFFFLDLFCLSTYHKTYFTFHCVLGSKQRASSLFEVRTKIYSQGVFHSYKLINTLLKIADVVDFHCLNDNMLISRDSRLSSWMRCWDRGLPLPPLF